MNSCIATPAHFDPQSHNGFPMNERRKFSERSELEAQPLEQLLLGTSAALFELLHSNGVTLARHEWEGQRSASQIGSGRGWVYAFYKDRDYPVYAGETGRRLKERIREHSAQEWWTLWTELVALPCPDKAMRKVFESLITMSDSFQYNRLQPTGGDTIFDEVFVAWESIPGNESRAMVFPNQVVCNYVSVATDLLAQLKFFQGDD